MILAALEHASDGGRQLLGCGLLVQVAGRAGFQGAHGILVLQDAMLSTNTARFGRAWTTSFSTSRPLRPGDV